MGRKSVLFLGCFTLLSANAFADEAKATLYVRSCRYEAPLDTYSRCAAGSRAGEQAEQCALNEAIGACREGANADCIQQSTTYLSIISDEFIGYKACEVTVAVRGYRVN